MHLILVDRMFSNNLKQLNISWDDGKRNSDHFSSETPPLQLSIMS